MAYIGFLVLINAGAFFLFADDKARSAAGTYRIPEFRLLMFAAAGGSLGAILAQRYIRHKTRKQPFADMLLLIIGLQLGAIFGIGALYLAIA